MPSGTAELIMIVGDALILGYIIGMVVTDRGWVKYLERRRREVNRGQ